MVEHDVCDHQHIHTHIYMHSLLESLNSYVERPQQGHVRPLVIVAPLKTFGPYQINAVRCASGVGEKES